MDFQYSVPSKNIGTAGVYSKPPMSQPEFGRGKRLREKNDPLDGSGGWSTFIPLLIIDTWFADPYQVGNVFLVKPQIHSFFPNVEVEPSVPKIPGV